jgi:hypothetical protein
VRRGVGSNYRDDDTLKVADAARVAQRSVRTIRRAYLSGKLLAHRDGNGRNVTIRYSDLRHWLLANEITPSPNALLPRPVGRDEVQPPAKRHPKTGNLELLTAARSRRRRAARGFRSGRAAAR